MVYIGRTKNFQNRAKEHKYNYSKGKGNAKIREFLKKHSDAVFKFEVVLFTDDIKKKEEEYIEKYNATVDGFNILKNDDDRLQKLACWRRNQQPKQKPKQQSSQKQKRKPKKANIFSEREFDEYLQLPYKEIACCKMGYVRKAGKLLYAPSLAKEVLKQLAAKELPKKKEETIKKTTKRITKRMTKKITKRIKKSKYSMRDKDWEPLDLSFFYTPKKAKKDV